MSNNDTSEPNKVESIVATVIIDEEKKQTPEKENVTLKVHDLRDKRKQEEFF